MKISSFFPRQFCTAAGISALVFLLAPVSQAQETPPETDPAAEASADGFVPKEYSLDRYAKIRGKSPFEFELAKPPAEITVDPFADLVLAGYAGSLSSPTVYVVNTKTQERITVVSENSGKPAKSGFKVISVDRGRTLRSSTVTLEKDGVQSVLKFDSKALDTMTGGAGGGGAAGGPKPGMPGMPGNVPRPAVPGQPARPQAAYQAPQAFIPGASRAGVQPQAQAQAQNGVFIPNQNLGTAQRPGAQLTNQPGGDTQVQLNNLLNNASSGQPQPTVIPNTATPQPNTSNVPTQPRRRVVLPTP